MKNDYAIRTLEIELAKVEDCLRLADRDSMKHKCEIPGSKEQEEHKKQLINAIETLKTADDYKCCGNCENRPDEKLCPYYNDNYTCLCFCKSWISDGLKQSERMITEAQDEK